MKTISVLLSILIILSLWIPFAASGLPSSTTKVILAGLNNQASPVQSGNPALLGTTIQQKALESLFSHPTPMSGGDSSNSSGQGQNGSGQGQMGSGQGQMGSGQGQMGSGQGETGTVIWQIPVTPYQSPYQNLGGVNLWIDTSQGRMQYAVVQQYSSISLIASTPLGGQGVVYELYPITTGQGAYTTNIYSLNPGDNQLGFVANIVGRHILLFSIDNQISNAVVVDVQASINSLDQQSNGGLLGQGMPGQ